MSSYLIIEGNVTADATLRQAPGRDGRSVAVSNATVAVNDRRFDRQNERWVDTGRTYYEITVWGGEAEHFANTAVKGARIIAAGETYVEEYRDRENNQRTRRRLQADHHGLSSKFTAVGPRTAHPDAHAETQDAETAPVPEPEPVG